MERLRGTLLISQLPVEPQPLFAASLRSLVIALFPRQKGGPGKHLSPRGHRGCISLSRQCCFQPSMPLPHVSAVIPERPQGSAQPQPQFGLLPLKHPRESSPEIVVLFF